MIVYTANIVEPTDTMHKDIKSKNAELCIYDDISNTNIQHISHTGFISQLQCCFWTYSFPRKESWVSRGNGYSKELDLP